MNLACWRVYLCFRHCNHRYLVYSLMIGRAGTDPLDILWEFSAFSLILWKSQLLPVSFYTATILNSIEILLIENLFFTYLILFHKIQVLMLHYSLSSHRSHKSRSHSTSWVQYLKSEYIITKSEQFFILSSHIAWMSLYFPVIQMLVH